MSGFALVHEGTICQISLEKFPVAGSIRWIDLARVSPAPAVGWLWNGAEFTSPPALASSLDDRVANLEVAMAALKAST